MSAFEPGSDVAKCVVEFLEAADVCRLARTSKAWYFEKVCLLRSLPKIAFSDIGRLPLLPDAMCRLRRLDLRAKAADASAAQHMQQQNLLQQPVAVPPRHIPQGAALTSRVAAATNVTASFSRPPSPGRGSEQEAVGDAPSGDSSSALVSPPQIRRFGRLLGQDGGSDERAAAATAFPSTRDASFSGGAAGGAGRCGRASPPLQSVDGAPLAPSLQPAAAAAAQSAALIHAVATVNDESSWLDALGLSRRASRRIQSIQMGAHLPREVCSKLLAACTHVEALSFKDCGRIVSDDVSDKHAAEKALSDALRTAAESASIRLDVHTVLFVADVPLSQRSLPCHRSPDNTNTVPSPNPPPSHLQLFKGISLPRLRVLDLGNACRLTIKALEYLTAGGCPSIQKLSLAGCKGISLTDVSQILPRFQSLQALEVDAPITDVRGVVELISRTSGSANSSSTQATNGAPINGPSSLSVLKINGLTLRRDSDGLSWGGFFAAHKPAAVAAAPGYKSTELSGGSQRRRLRVELHAPNGLSDDIVESVMMGGGLATTHLEPLLLTGQSQPPPTVGLSAKNSQHVQIVITGGCLASGGHLERLHKWLAS